MENNFISNVVPFLQCVSVVENHLVSLLTHHVICTWILAHIVILLSRHVGERNASYVVNSIFKQVFLAFSNEFFLESFHHFFLCGIASTILRNFHKRRMQKARVPLKLRKLLVVLKKERSFHLCIQGKIWPLFCRFHREFISFTFWQFFHCLLLTCLENALAKQESSGNWTLDPLSTLFVKFKHELNVVVHCPIEMKVQCFS